MSKHWDPRIVQGRRPYPRRRPKGVWPKAWNQYRRGLLSAGEMRLMLLGGLFLGLAAAGLGSLWQSGETASGVAGLTAPDPYAESRRSRAILEAQEAAPPSAYAERADSGVTLVGAEAWVDVIDGDTFDYGGDRIRIADIDTPEVNGRCAYESALAARATERMAELLAEGPFELHPVERDTDSYGRKLRIVTRGGHSLGDQLVAEGLARTWTGRRRPWCGEQA